MSYFVELLCKEKFTLQLTKYLLKIKHVIILIQVAPLYNLQFQMSSMNISNDSFIHNYT